MYKKIIKQLEDKNIAILGFGIEGKSTYNFIRRYLPTKHITIIDKNNIELKDNNVNISIGDDYLEYLSQYDVIIKSPGISLKDIKDESIRSKITSQLELILEVNRDNIIGITGTKGKSTTSTLLYEVIKEQNDNTALLGNIGIPILDNIEDFKEDTTLVIEMSSQQLEFIKISPHIGIILNLYQDHLDHAGSLEHYHDNKMNIIKYQNENDYAMYSEDNEYIEKLLEKNNIISKKIPIHFNDLNTPNSIYIKNKNIYLNNELLYKDSNRYLIGDHNLNNIMFIVGVCKLLNLDLEKASKTIYNFKGLKYRMECIGTYNDITYYNDTIATIPDASINAVKAIGNVDTLIFGGLDRKIDYSGFIKFLRESNISNLVCMPTTGTNIGKELEDSNKNIFYVDTLEEAYEKAKENTKKNCSCILSPAAASYEFFKNFEEKGKAFENIVKKDI